MKLDPHIHSCYSRDTKSRPEDIIKKARKIGLNIIAISDHDSVKGSKLGINLSKDINEVFVVPSIEISSNEGHILGFGVDSVISKGLTPEETVDKIHDEGGIAIIPHPFSFYRNGSFFNNKKTLKNLVKNNSNNYDKYKKNNKITSIEGVEVLNARYIIGYSNYRANKLAAKHDLAKIGSSDSHFIESIGNCYTELVCIDNKPNVDDIIEAIRSKKTIAKGNKTSNYLIAKEIFNKKIKGSY